MTISGRPDVRQLRTSLTRTVPRSLGPQNYQLFSSIRPSLWPSRPPYRLIRVTIHTDLSISQILRVLPGRVAFPCPLSRPQRRRFRQRRQSQVVERAACGWSEKLTSGRCLRIAAPPCCADFRISTPNSRPRGPRRRRLSLSCIVDGVMPVMPKARARAGVHARVAHTARSAGAVSYFSAEWKVVCSPRAEGAVHGFILDKTLSRPCNACQRVTRVISFFDMVK